jgi:hypothetical protein
MKIINHNASGSFQRARVVIFSVVFALLTAALTCAEIERRTEAIDPMYQEDEVDVMVDYGATLQAEETATAEAKEEEEEAMQPAPNVPDVAADEEEEEPSPPQEFLFHTKYSGRYTDVLSQEVGGAAKWKCSTNDSHWHDLIFTYKPNDDGTITLIGITVDGAVRESGPWKTYERIDDHTFVEEHETGNGTRKETLKFSASQIEISTLFRHSDGSSGTCTISIPAAKE